LRDALAPSHEGADDSSYADRDQSYLSLLVLWLVASSRLESTIFNVQAAARRHN
jgi:hypothetical protein